MAEETQPNKKHKSSLTYSQHDIPQASPIGDELDTFLPIPIGQEEKRENGYDNSEGESSFRETDVCTILDDN